jgi:hypothetical protein
VVSDSAKHQLHHTLTAHSWFIISGTQTFGASKQATMLQVTNPGRLNRSSGVGGTEWSSTMYPVLLTAA